MFKLANYINDNYLLHFYYNNDCLKISINIDNDNKDNDDKEDKEDKNNHCF